MRKPLWFVPVLTIVFLLACSSPTATPVPDTPPPDTVVLDTPVPESMEGVAATATPAPEGAAAAGSATAVVPDPEVTATAAAAMRQERGATAVPPASVAPDKAAVTPVASPTAMPGESGAPVPEDGGGEDAIVPVSMELESFLPALSPGEISCLSEIGDPAALVAVLGVPPGAELDSAAQAELALGCLSDETLTLSLISGALVGSGPLSAKSSACVREGFQELDLRGAVLAGISGGLAPAEWSGMIGFILVSSCLDAGDGPDGAPAMGLGVEFQERLPCLMRELGGPLGLRAALHAALAGTEDASALAEAATACGVSWPEGMPFVVMLEDPDRGDGGASDRLAPLSLEDPEAFLAALPDSESSCMVEELGEFGVDRLRLLYDDPDSLTLDESLAVYDCLAPESLLRVFVTGLLSFTEPLGGETSACLRSSFGGPELRALMTPQPVAASPSEEGMMDALSAYFLTLSCLSERDWELAAGVALGDRESIHCLVSELGGRESLLSQIGAASSDFPMSLSGAMQACGVEWMPVG